MKIENGQRNLRILQILRDSYQVFCGTCYSVFILYSQRALISNLMTPIETSGSGMSCRVEDVTSSNPVYTIFISQFHPKLFVVGCFRLRITFKAIQQKVFQKTFIGDLGSSHFLYRRRSRLESRWSVNASFQ